MTNYYRISGYTIMLSGVFLSIYILFLQLQSGFIETHLQISLMNFLAKVVLPPLLILALSFFPGRFYTKLDEKGNKILLVALITKVVSLALIFPPLLYLGFRCLALECTINISTLFFIALLPLIGYITGLILMLVPLLTKNVE